MKFLLVEDEPKIATLIQRLLRRESYIVDIAEDLELAREALLSNEYEVVILDRMLPDGEVRTIRSSGRPIFDEDGELKGWRCKAQRRYLKPLEMGTRRRSP